MNGFEVVARVIRCSQMRKAEWQTVKLEFKNDTINVFFNAYEMNTANETKKAIKMARTYIHNAICSEQKKNVSGHPEIAFYVPNIIYHKNKYLRQIFICMVQVGPFF